MIVKASRLLDVKFSRTLAIGKRASELQKAGREIISLGLGELSTEIPSSIRQATAQAALRGEGQSGPVDGLPDLRKRIAAKLKAVNKLCYDPSQIQISSGSKQIIFNAIMATLNPGDEVIIPAPYWVSYPEIVRLASGKPVFVVCPAEQGYKLIPEQLEAAITPKSRWLILNSPNNPSGAVYSPAELAALAGVVRRHAHLMVLSDEIYEYFVFRNNKFVSFAAVASDLKDRVLTVNGFSKSFAMIGWRVGYGAGASELIDAMNCIQSHMTSGIANIVQYGAIEGLDLVDQETLHDLGRIYGARSEKAVAALEKIPGVKLVKPDGAFYVYLDCSSLIGKRTLEGKAIESDFNLAEHLLESCGVVTIPGSAFGLGPALRLSLTCDEASLIKALALISSTFAQLR